MNILKPALLSQIKPILSLMAQSLFAASLFLTGLWTVKKEPLPNRNVSPLLSMPATVVEAILPMNEEAFKISQVLRLHTSDTTRASRIANAIVFEGRKKHINSSLIVGVMLTEDDVLNPTARSFVGARGLMQVMPAHSGKWGCNSKNLFDIEANICHGVAILADNIHRSSNLHMALLKYNGCVRGTNTPNCSRYPLKVLARAAQATTKMQSVAYTINR